MAFEDLVKQVAVSLEHDGRVQAVFGEAMKLEHHTIVPVAVVSGAGGAGGTQSAANSSFAGGGGLGLNVRPVGFIYEHGDEVLFTPIHLDGRNRPLWTEAAFGLRRAIDLASSLATQFMHRVTPRASSAVVVDEPNEVTSPS